MHENFLILSCTYNNNNQLANLLIKYLRIGLKKKKKHVSNITFYNSIDNVSCLKFRPKFRIQIGYMMTPMFSCNMTTLPTYFKLFLRVMINSHKLTQVLLAYFFLTHMLPRKMSKKSSNVGLLQTKPFLILKLF